MPRVHSDLPEGRTRLQQTITSERREHNKQTSGEVNPNDPRYPRHGFVLALRRVLLLLTSIMLAYGARVAVNVYQLAGVDPRRLLDPDQIRQLLLLPAEVYNARTPPWLYVITIVAVTLVVAGCFWAAEDRVYESRVERKRELEGMIERLPNELNIQDRPILDISKLQHLREPYLMHTKRLWETFESPLLPLHIELPQIAVQLRMSELSTRTHGERAVKLPGYRRKGINESHTVSATLVEYLENEQAQERWVILGDPGTGKTTLLRFEAYRYAQRSLESQESPIPVYVSLASLGMQIQRDASSSIYDYLDALGRSVALHHLGDWVTLLAKEGRVIFLLDGLDEVADAERSSLVERIRAAIPEGRGNRIVYTSRKVGFTQLIGYQNLEIEPLTIDDQRKVMLAICGKEKTALLLRNMAGARDIQDMASVPITLTVLALIARESGDDFTDYLHRHADLFRFGARILLEGRHRNNQGVANPEKAESVLAAASLSLQIQAAREGEESFQTSEVEAAVLTATADDLAPWNSPRQFIDDVSAHSSLLFPTDSLRRHYRYLHRTFREFFAASELAREPEHIRRGFVAQVVNQQQWAEVLVLLGGLTPDVQAYLHQLLDGPPDLALRTLREVRNLDPQLATEVLQLKPGDRRARRQVFLALAEKLESPEQTVAVLRAYLDAMEDRVPRADLYFIDEVLTTFDLDSARELREDLFRYLPRAKPGIMESANVNNDRLPYFCDVPGGVFLLGASPDDAVKPSWVSVYREVDVSSFQIGRIPVTNAMYEQFDPYHRALRDFRDEVPESELDQHPVVQVSWYEACMFCRWLAKTVPGVRLPTEAEWEKAASWTPDGHKRLFPWGNEWNPALLNCWESGPNRTTLVGSYPLGQSPCGALDMAGNVWEWCADWFDDDITQYLSDLENTPKNPHGPAKGRRRVDRGGGWYFDVSMPFTYIRAADDPADVFSHCGFRLARSTVSLEMASAL